MVIEEDRYTMCDYTLICNKTDIQLLLEKCHGFHDSCIYEIKLNSRHYAKRQLSWFRYMSKNDIDLSKSDKSMVEILGQLEKSLKFGP